MFQNQFHRILRQNISRNRRMSLQKLNILLKVSLDGLRRHVWIVRSQKDMRRIDTVQKRTQLGRRVTQRGVVVKALELDQGLRRTDGTVLGNVSVDETAVRALSEEWEGGAGV